MLGRGAAGDVYLARDLLLRGREVALKRIRARVDEGLRIAFEREFSTMASLSVPGVAQVHDFGVMDAEDGSGEAPYYTRDYVEGEPLDVAADGIPPAGLIDLVRRSARVIAPLHRVGVVHGDIKPGNVIVDAQGDPHVIDFGLARLMGQGEEEPGSSSGTLAFMAPELLRGHAGTAQTDVFALGVTLWYLLARDYPFGPRGLLGQGKAKPPALPKGIDPATGGGLEVARRARTHDPLDRLPTVEELIAALDEVSPPDAADARPRLFVAPRPRGHAETLGRLHSLSTTAAATPGPRSVLLQAPVGGGKSLLLRELKWRMQLRGVHAVEVAGASGGVAAPLTSLFRQLTLGQQPSVTATAERAITMLNEGDHDEGKLSDALAEVLAAACTRGRVVLLLDDLDATEGLFGSILRSALYADGDNAIAAVATAAHADAPAVRKLAPGDTIEVPRLTREHVEALAGDAMGPLDASVLEALHRHTEGIPGAVVDSLASLSQLTAATVADVEQLPAPGASVALATARIDRAPEGGELLLQTLLSLGGACESSRLAAACGVVGIKSERLAPLLARCEKAGLVRIRPDGVALADVALERALLQTCAAERLAELSGQLLDARALSGWPVELRAKLAVRGGREDAIRELLPDAAARLSDRGAHGAAASLYSTLMEHIEGEAGDRARLSLARERQALGELELASELAREVRDRDGASAELTLDAAILSAHLLTALGRYEEAVETLSAIPEDVEAAARARICRDLAKVHLRRADYDALLDAAGRGLALVEDDLVRAELLCSKAMASSYRADHDAARAELEEAVALCRRAGSPRDEATARATLAIAHFRVGDMLAARDMFAQCLEIARRLGDVGSMANFSQNLGAMLYCLGEPASAAEHYESAARLARRAGRLSTDAQARCNLAHVHIYFGLFERAKGEIGAVLEYAADAGQRYIEAQATALTGDLAARAGDVDRALIRYDDALAKYQALGQTREVADHNLDAAEALLDRAGPADASAAAARLASAREHIDNEGLDDLRLRLDMLTSRARLVSGDAEGALAGLEEVVERAREARNRDVEWSALSASAVAHEALGAEFAARRFNRMAIEVLEDIALRIPREHREAFWHDPRRRVARTRAVSAEESSHGAPASGELSTLIGDPRAERLLEIIKRLAGEHDLDRLLERITESAVDLSGAERGFVLLTDSSGQLEKRTVRVSKRSEPDPHEAFSRSIAEAVLIDGEPIVTTDATHDGRLSEFVSVHKLMLRSVACLPISGPAGTVGVLYLEHRRSRGRFTDASVDLLHAFADQAAIALENARLIGENQRRQTELEAANGALEKAKQDLEELLSSRTDELEETRRELKRARRSRKDSAMRHGMVGKSAVMGGVFDTIDRLKDAAVPVVIHGESGTGKELVARAIHYGGGRAKGQFVAINCGSVPESLLESELFGHVKGAFSGADRDKRGLISRASGGTLFLDEVGDMPAKMQVDLLRVLQEGTVCKVGSDREERVDVRVIAASNKRLDEMVARREFREDLFYRLNVVELRLPALRERREDIPLLCQYFLDTFAERDGRPAKRLSRGAMERLLGHGLPGNVRQLEHLLLQAWVMVDGATIEATDLALDGMGAPAPEAPPQPDVGGIVASAMPPAPEAIEPAEVPVKSRAEYQDAEKVRILAALEDHGWNRARAAKALGIPRRTFYRRLQQYGIQ